jgi:hypothetical protein
MLPTSMYQDLLKYRAVLHATLEANHFYQRLQAVNTLIAIHDRETGFLRPGS